MFYGLSAKRSLSEIGHQKVAFCSRSLYLCLKKNSNLSKMIIYANCFISRQINGF